MQPYTCFSPLSWYLLFFSFTSRLYKRIRDAEMCQLQIFSPPTEKSRSFRLRRFSTRADSTPGFYLTLLQCYGDGYRPLVLIDISLLDDGVCVGWGFIYTSSLFSGIRKKWGTVAFSRCFRSHFLRTWLFRLLHTFHPLPQTIWWKKGRQNNNQSIQLIPWLHIPLPRNSVTSCSVASSSIGPSVFWRKRKKV